MDAVALKTPASRQTRSARGFCWFAALLVAATVFAPSSPAAEKQPARSADAFVDSIGLNTHTFFDDTAYYTRFDLVKQRLVELGVRHLREDLVPERPDQYERLTELAGIGVRSTLILGDPDDGVEEIETLASILRDDLHGAVEAVEGPNEYDARGGPEWLPRLHDYQQRLYGAIKSDPALASLPVVGPSVVQRRNQEALGDVSSVLDYGNVHSYPDGFSPETNISSHLERAANNSAAKPVMATETGYHTTAGWSGEHNPVSEAAMAVYVPRMFLEYFRRGVTRTFSYELLDQKPEPSERESNFGLLRNDLSEKPAFTALRNLIDILEDPGPAFAPAGVAYSIAGDARDVRHVLLQKRDGTFWLAIWRAADVLDPESGSPIDVPSGSVVLGFTRQVTAGQTYLPNVSSAPVAPLRVLNGNAVEVDVGARVTILALALGKAEPGRIRAWVSRRSVRAGGSVAVRGRLPKVLTGRSLRVKIQQWRGHGWRTVSRARTTRAGLFRRRIRISRRHAGRASRVRVVARVARPSRPLRVRVRS